MKEMQEISAIKIAVESYTAVGGNPATLLKESAEWLFTHYEVSGDAFCLKAAVQLVRVYMELGLLYVAAQEVFDKILATAGTTYEEEFPKRICRQDSISCNVSKVRELLGYWPYTRGKIYNAQRVAESICEKVRKQEYGSYFYEKRENEIAFELLIVKENAYLMDIQKSKIYVFEKCKEEE